ncbi:MAG: hypothetical protein K0S55_1052 [Clostridia bacterium]|nr:hypothetical protein [Clostridia bacterium]
MKLTSKERIMRVFRGEAYDRPVLKLWGFDIGQGMLHPDYKPVYNEALKITDIFSGAGSAFNIRTGTNEGIYEYKETPTKDPEWVEYEAVIHTTDGDLKQVYLGSTIGKPGYMKEYFVKEPKDIKKLLSVKYEAYPININDYFNRKNFIGDKGIVTFGLDHAGYALQTLTGSETLAYWSIEERELVNEVIDIFAKRIYDHTKAVLDAGLSKEKDVVFAWVGPELLIPPLLSFNDFREFSKEKDRSLNDLIHNNGGYVWTHCHGKVGKLLEDFIDIGTDVLNPIEPPPMGDITLEDAFKITKGHMGLEGNIEIGDIMIKSEDDVRELTTNAINTGKKYNRFILCPSAGYMEVPNPPKKYIDNLMCYLKTAKECLEI